MDARRADLLEFGDVAVVQQAEVGRLPTINALHAIKASGDYYFWSGASKPKSAVGDYQRALRTLFDLAKAPRVHAHLFRHTFATELLTAGNSLETVAALLRHSSTKITERS
jgi:integrase